MSKRTMRSGDLDLHFPDFLLDGAVAGVLAELAQIGIAREPFEIAVAEGEGFFEGTRGEVEFTIERVAAGEIVKDKRIFWLKAGQLFVHLQAVVEVAALGVVVAEDLQSFDVLRGAANDSLHEGNLDV